MVMVVIESDQYDGLVDATHLSPTFVVFFFLHIYWNMQNGINDTKVSYIGKLLNVESIAHQSEINCTFTSVYVLHC